MLIVLFNKEIKPTVAYGVIVASIALGIIAIVAARPWGPELGPSFSPARIALAYAATFLTLFLPGIIVASLFIKDPRFKMPLMRTRKAEKSMFSTYTLTAAAVVAAVYAVGGILTGVNIDLPALITGFTATYFGPVVSLIAWLVGFFVRWAIGGAPWLRTALLVPTLAMIDSGTWALASYIYWKVARIVGKYSILRIALGILAMILVHMYGWICIYAGVLNPAPAAVAYIAFAFSTWYPTAIAFIVLGAIVGEAAYKKARI